MQVRKKNCDKWGLAKTPNSSGSGGGLKLSKKAFVHKLLFKTFLEMSLQCKGVAAKKCNCKSLKSFGWPNLSKQQQHVLLGLQKTDRGDGGHDDNYEIRIPVERLR